jgi:hypothetical protein
MVIFLVSVFFVRVGMIRAQAISEQLNNRGGRWRKAFLSKTSQPN